jgi:hypothetical protein|tara:strand:- start:139 stop:489 length:351 start_codon:yes stop_codon:yes gene_type:complete
MSKWFNFRQNNSGGVWYGPAMNVAVQADSADEANSIAEQHGIYFDGVQTGSDCECCGDRWYGVYSDEGENEYMEAIGSLSSSDIRWADESGIPVWVAHFRNGSVMKSCDSTPTKEV